MKCAHRVERERWERRAEQIHRLALSVSGEEEMFVSDEQGVERRKAALAQPTPQDRCSLDQDGSRPCELSIVVPTLNERGNVALLVERLASAVSDLRWELIFVDDASPDGTAQCVRALCAHDSRIRLIERTGRRGLSSACIEGMRACCAPLIAVMDADLQHDESILPAMVRLACADGLELVVGSRYISGGSMGGFSPWRRLLSVLGKAISRTTGCTQLSDPMSGFFLIRHSFFEEVAGRLDGRGFKILLDLVASSGRPVRFGEVGYRFRHRARGMSKLSFPVLLDYLFQLARNWVRPPGRLRLAAGTRSSLLGRTAAPDSRC